MKYFLYLLLLALALPSCAGAAAPDTLVVCPTEFREALAPWEKLRRDQGHELEIVGVPRDAADLQAKIRQVAGGGKLEYLVLVGDVPINAMSQEARRVTIPTNYSHAEVNRQWGSEPTIATDLPYADIDGDGQPDLAVGRIPADSPAQLAAVVRKIIRYETETEPQPWDRRLAAVAGTGDFGVLADSLIEAAGQQIMNKALPSGYLVALARAKTGSAALGPFVASKVKSNSPAAGEARRYRAALDQMSDGCLLWVYLGHANPTELDYVAGPAGPESILSVADVPQLHCNGHCPLAMLVACYTGACDASRDCLGEEMLLAEDGPVTVIAATRVTMPYGNTILSYEFLRASLVDRPATLGAAFRLAQRRTLAAGDGDAMRKSLDTMASGLCPLLQRGDTPWRPADLVTERREHVAMYQLLGDPLLKWRRPQPMNVAASADAIAGRTIEVESQADFDGQCLVELDAAAATGRDADSSAIASVTQAVRSGKIHFSLAVPADASGEYTVRTFLQGKNDSALGGTRIVVRREQSRAAESKQP